MGSLRSSCEYAGSRAGQGETILIIGSSEERERPELIGAFPLLI
jgi:hypothetical protein